MEPEWRGMFFIKTGGVFFKMGRGLGGILAGYLNYWRPNLPQYVIRRLSKCVMICFGYHTDLGDVNCSDL